MSSAAPLCPVAGNQGRKRWVAGWSQWRACAWLRGPAAGVCVVSGAGCRHTRCGGSQSRQQGPGPMTGSLQLRDPGCPCVSPLAAQQWSPAMVHQAGSLQVHSVCAAVGSQPGGPCWCLVLRGLDWLPMLSRAPVGGGWWVRSREGGMQLVGISECKSMLGESWDICRGPQSCAGSWSCPR